MRWVMAFLALSTCSAMAAGLQVGSGLLPPESLTTWAPGVRGIPTRTRVCATVNAATYGNGGNDASAGIQAAVNACPVGEVVQLSAGTFTVNNRILISKGITLRGAGPGLTTLQKTNPGAEQEQILRVAPSQWPHVDETTAVNLTADAVQGARSVTVASGAGFAPGQFVKLDEDDYTTATWMALPPRIGSTSSPRVLATDRIVWPIHSPAAVRGPACAQGVVVVQSRRTAARRDQGSHRGQREYHHLLDASAHHLHHGESRSTRPVHRLGARSTSATLAWRT